MATATIDALGLKCPQPVLKITAKSPDMKPGDLLEIIADCPTFDKDVKTWCQRMNKTLLFVRDQGGGKKLAQIQF